MFIFLPFTELKFPSCITISLHPWSLNGKFRWCRQTFQLTFCFCGLSSWASQVLSCSHIYKANHSCTSYLSPIYLHISSLTMQLNSHTSRLVVLLLTAFLPGKFGAFSLHYWFKMRKQVRLCGFSFDFASTSFHKTAKG